MFSTESTIDWWVNEAFVLKSKKSNGQIKKPGLWKEQERLELVTELSRELPSLFFGHFWKYTDQVKNV